MKAAKIAMKCIGGTLAICSAVAMAGGMMTSSASSTTKKSMKKTAEKICDFVDSVSEML